MALWQGIVLVRQKSECTIVAMGILLGIEIGLSETNLKEFFFYR
jgi:hypothetical protein